MSQRPVNHRRTFTVREQLRDKLGPGAFGTFLQQLEAEAKKQTKRRPKAGA